jgi:RNA polymerase sigma factor (sigma-70 family)
MNGSSVHHPSSSAEALAPPTPTAPWSHVSERELFGLVDRCMHTLVSVADRDFEDLVQAAATEVWRSRESFQGRSELASWVYGVCYRVLLNHRRFWRRFRLRFDIGVAAEPASDAPHSVELLEERQRAEKLREALGRLSDKHRAVVVLHDLEGFDVADIASIVLANTLTVRSRLRDGRRKLRRLLKLRAGLVWEEA